MGYQLGVDIGTTYTAAAVTDGGPPSMLGLGNRAMQIPSVLFLQEDGEFLVGEAAERRAAAEPSRAAREFKRRMGDHVPLLVAGTPQSPQSLTARLLRWVLDEATKQLGGSPTAVTVTHPAAWGPYRLELLQQVLVLADAGDARTCPEPLAAAVQHAAQTRVEPGARLAVYDLGGGTFDVCVLEKTEESFTILGVPEGIEHLGGIDFDQALFAHVLDGLGAAARELDPADPAVTTGLMRLRRECVEAKEALTSDVDTILTVTLPGIETTVRVTRPEFEELIRPTLTDTVAAMQRALRSAQVEPEELTAIVLVGGSSRIPLVSQLLHSAFDTHTALDTHPKHDIALGAVQHHRANAAPAAARGAPPAEAAIDPPVTTAPPEAEVAGGADATAPEVARPPGSGRPEPPRSWRRPVAALAALVVVATGVVVAVNLVGDAPEQGDSVQANTAGPAQTPGRGASPSPASTAVGGTVPASTALTDTQLLVPMLVDGNEDIFLAETSQPAPVRRLIHGPDRDTNPALSPDRRTMAYIVQDADGRKTLRLAAVDGAGARDLFDPVPQACEGGALRPAWNPTDPDQLAVVCLDSKKRYGLYLVDTSGRIIRELQTGQAKIGDPAFSPDGTTVAYWAGPQVSRDGGTLFTLPLDGSTPPRQLAATTILAQDADPAWSPDGELIAYRHRLPGGARGGNFQIRVIAANGAGQPTTLTDDGSTDQDPSWSPSGTDLAVKSDRPSVAGGHSDRSRIWLMSAKGDDLRLLWPDSPGAGRAPAWTRR